MDLARYEELKEKGLVTLQLVGEQVIVISKEYDPATGTPLKDKAVPVDEPGLLSQKATLIKHLGAITALLEDVEVAKA